MGKKGISEVIASIVMIVITISLAGVAYGYIMGVFTSKTSTTFSIVDAFQDTIAIRNDGTTPIDQFSIVTVDGSPATYLVEPQDSSLVGHWKFDEGSDIVAADSSGRGNTGTLVNNPAWVDGKYGKSLDFNGIDTYVELNDTLDFTGTSPFSITIWVKPNVTIPNSWTRIVEKDQTLPVREGYLIFHQKDTGYICFERWVSGSKVMVCSISALPTVEYTSVAATYDGSKLRIYANGDLQELADDTRSVSDHSSPLRIGSASFGNEVFDGSIDEVRIYNRSITDGEVKAIHSIGAQINPGKAATIKIYGNLSSGAHTAKICTPGMCQSAYLYIG